MAVEVNSTRLHRHAAPVALLLVGVIAVSIVAISSYGSRHVGSEPQIVRALFGRVVHVQSAGNGVAHVGLYHTQPAGRAAAHTGSQLSIPAQ